MIATLAALGLLGQVIGDPAQPKPAGPRAVIGTGAQPCAIAMSPNRRLEAQTWALGYWSGVNAAGPRTVTVDGGVEGLLARVDAYCKAHTGVPLQDAVQQVLTDRDDR